MLAEKMLRPPWCRLRIGNAVVEVVIRGLPAVWLWPRVMLSFIYGPCWDIRTRARNMKAALKPHIHNTRRLPCRNTQFRGAPNLAKNVESHALARHSST